MKMHQANSLLFAFSRAVLILSLQSLFMLHNWAIYLHKLTSHLQTVHTHNCQEHEPESVTGLWVCKLGCEIPKMPMGQWKDTTDKAPRFLHEVCKVVSRICISLMTSESPIFCSLSLFPPPANDLVISVGQERNELL